MTPVSKLAKTVSFCAFIAAAGTAPALAQTAFDGAWSVRFVPETGDCPAHTFPIRVADGRISLAAFGVTVKGAIRADGGLKVQVSHASDWVAASGSVGGSTGSGRWISPTKSCGGSWTARRG